ncbi:MAG: response regulator [Planctomycetota bacterium]|nr:response regulator [Planctomycetota bacterium]
MVASARILVVDDEPVVTKSCRRILGDAGYRVDTATSVQEGLSRAVAGDFDLVMTDLRFPEMSGMDLVRALRNKRPEVAVVIITGYGSVPTAVEAVKLGVSDFVEKPFTPEQIMEVVIRAVGGRSPPAVQIEADQVRQVLRLAARDPTFSRRLLAEGSHVLSGYALSPAAKAAIASGDIAWVEKECGELSLEERVWLKQRLETETC